VAHAPEGRTQAPAPWGSLMGVTRTLWADFAKTHSGFKFPPEYPLSPYFQRSGRIPGWEGDPGQGTTPVLTQRSCAQIHPAPTRLLITKNLPLIIRLQI
jgi:hypothetical protein